MRHAEDYRNSPADGKMTVGVTDLQRLKQEFRPEWENSEQGMDRRGCSSRSTRSSADDVQTCPDGWDLAGCGDGSVPRDP